MTGRELHWTETLKQCPFDARILWRLIAHQRLTIKRVKRKRKGKKTRTPRTSRSSMRKKRKKERRKRRYLLGYLRESQDI